MYNIENDLAYSYVAIRAYTKSMKVLPKTQLGKWSIGLIVAAFCLLIIGVIVVRVFHQTGGKTIFSNLYISIPMLSAGASAVAAFVTGVISVWKYKERGLLVAVPIIIGFLVTMFMIGEFSTPH